jgi:hypothetical protein
MPLMRVLAAGVALALAGCSYGYRTGGMGYVEYRTSPLMLWSQPSPRPAEPAPDRKISEQDCTAPIASATANLKCR